jgi:hypothetical protein
MGREVSLFLKMLCKQARREIKVIKSRDGKKEEEGKEKKKEGKRLRERKSE